ncbi:hypothetical protein RRG08_022051 [Elysia crispata]|uniref:Uncharacterized protein n=1 Tax=Elysia crispata TaxID=231223 RepID=A0AAE1D6F9_9GAST|nr:hypothetical protein RRG08_022051 [Elysia crispata]
MTGRQTHRQGDSTTERERRRPAFRQDDKETGRQTERKGDKVSDRETRRQDVRHRDKVNLYPTIFIPPLRLTSIRLSSSLLLGYPLSDCLHPPLRLTSIRLSSSLLLG